MSEDEERLRADAQASREETRRLREEAAGTGEEPGTDQPGGAPHEDGSEPSAKTPSSDAERR